MHRFIGNKFQLAMVCFVLVVNFRTVIAQDGKLRAEVDPDKIAANDQFQVKFIFSGSDANSLSNFKAPDFSKFVVISGPSQSTYTQWINGQVSSSITYTYILYARQSGRYKIGPATVEYKGKELKSDPIQIDVVQNTQKQNQKKDDKAETEVKVGDNLLIRAYTDKSHVRQGEQLTITFKLYTRLSVSGYDQVKAPTFDGFWSEDFEMPKQPTLTTETLNGKQYRSVVIKKTALFATRAGNLKIAPLEVRCAVQMQSKRRSNDLFDSFFSDPFFQQVQTVNVDVKSNPITIKVEPVPVNVPPGFSGGIGRFTFNANVDKRNVKAGDPITLKLVISGTGNIKLVTIPKPLLPADIESYEPKIAENISRDGGIIRGKKTAEYLLIPRNAGQRTIEPLRFVYFDLEKKEYVTLSSQKFEFKIEPGKDFSGGIESITSKEDVRILGEDIRFLKLSIGDFQRVNDTDSSEWFFIGLILPPFMFAGVWLYRKRMEKIYGDMPRLLFETAGRGASRRLKKARALLEQGNTESYHAEVLKALTQYLEHKLRKSKASLVMEEVLMRLHEHGVKQEVIQSLKTCMERAEFVRYAPGSDTTKARKELLDIATDIIKNIEHTFGKGGKR